MTFRGMDVEEVERLTAQLDLQAKAIETVVGVVDSAVAGLTGVWFGDDLQAFSAVWHSIHKPRAQNLGEQLGGWVGELRQQTAQQRAASGEPGGERPGWQGRLGSTSTPVAAAVSAASGVVAAAMGILGPSFRKSWDLTSPLRLTLDGAKLIPEIHRFRPLASSWNDSLKELKKYDAEDLGKFDEAHFHLTHGFRVAGGAISAAGMIIDTVSLAHALAGHDGNAAGIAGVDTGVDAINVVATRVPVLLPVAAVANVTAFVGEHVLPTDDAGFSGAYDQALHDHFGDTYDPSDPTPGQADWGLKHYSGIEGVLNTTVDGIKYQATHGFGLFG